MSIKLTHNGKYMEAIYERCPFKSLVGKGNSTKEAVMDLMETAISHNDCNPLHLIRTLREADLYINKVFLQGSCFKLYEILSLVYPTAKPYYSIVDGHWITEIKGRYYDIGGEISPEYIKDKGYELITDETTLTSASIPTHSSGIGVQYTKYINL